MLSVIITIKPNLFTGLISSNPLLLGIRAGSTLPLKKHVPLTCSGKISLEVLFWDRKFLSNLVLIYFYQNILGNDHTGDSFACYLSCVPINWPRQDIFADMLSGKDQILLGKPGILGS